MNRDHTYALLNKSEENTSSSTYSSSSESENDSLPQVTLAEPKNIRVKEPRARQPPKRHVDSYAVTTPQSSVSPIFPTNIRTSFDKKIATLSSRKSIGERKTKRPNRIVDKFYVSSLKLRSTPCGECDGCRRDDCAHCVYCTDKPKFGGPGKKKQKCILRACINMPIKPIKKAIAGKLVTMVTDTLPSTGDDSGKCLDKAKFEGSGKTKQSPLTLNTARDSSADSLPEELTDNPPQDLTDILPLELADNPPQELEDILPLELADNPPQELADILPQALTENPPQELADILPQELPDILPQALTDNPLADILPQALTDSLHQELADILPQALTDSPPQELADILPQASTDNPPQELPDILPQALTDNPPQELADILPRALTDSPPQEFADLLPQASTDNPPQKLTELLQELTDNLHQESTRQESTDQEPMEECVPLETKDQEPSPGPMKESEKSTGQSVPPVPVVLSEPSDKKSSPNKLSQSSTVSRPNVTVLQTQKQTSFFKTTASSSQPTTTVSEVITNMANKFVQSLITASKNSPTTSPTKSVSPSSSSSKNVPNNSLADLLSPKEAVGRVGNEVSDGRKRSLSRVTVTPLTDYRSAGSSDWRMRCEHCHRERFLKMARTERFCTQRCVLKWLEEHPDKTPKDAVGDSNVPFFSLPPLTFRARAQAPSTIKNKSSKSIPRLLKSLHIDMASPGTTLQPSSETNSEEDEVEIISVPDSKRSPSFQPTAIAAKRSQVSQQPLAIKKVKTKGRSISPYGNSKSVKFDLEATSACRPALPSSISIVSLEKLAEFMKEQSKCTFTMPTMDIKIPPGLKHSIKNWSIDDVCEYFRSTSDCSEFKTVFKEQEIDGFALLSLTNQTLCHCLALPLGKAIRIMAHVEELRKLI